MGRAVQMRLAAGAILLLSSFFCGCGATGEVAPPHQEGNAGTDLRTVDKEFRPSDYGREAEGKRTGGNAPAGEDQEVADTATVTTALEELAQGFRVQVFSTTDIDIAKSRMTEAETAFPPRRDRCARRRAAKSRDGCVRHACIRVVGPAESRRLNSEYRGKDRPTNVLSFPSSAEGRRLEGELGDLVICAGVVAREAREQGKTRPAQWTHMVVHGVLHLLGHDHVRRADAARMERLERRILAGLGHPDPYADDGR